MEKTGGQAFPIENGYGLNPKDCRGMTLRDYFAGQALAGMCSNFEELTDALCAKYAYSLADAMVNQRSKDNQ